MTKRIKSTALFIAMLVLCALTAWLGGYDFDYRSPDVAAGFVMALIVATIVAVMP
jgi:hypothetical protein